jgi:hypothetical protein
MFEARWNGKLAATDRLQGMPHHNNGRELASPPPPVATLLQIIDYPGTLV